MINESKKSPKFFNDRFKAVASSYLSDKYNITVEDISHTNLRQFYLSLVGYIENLMNNKQFIILAACEQSFKLLFLEHFSHL